MAKEGRGEAGKAIDRAFLDKYRKEKKIEALTLADHNRAKRRKNNNGDAVLVGDEEEEEEFAYEI